jgi:hypothetical protein
MKDLSSVLFVQNVTREMVMREGMPRKFIEIQFISFFYTLLFIGIIEARAIEQT